MYSCSPGDGLSCCCCQSDVRKSQFDVVWKVERSCRSESKSYAGRGNGKYRKQQGGKHFDVSKCEGWEKKKKNLKKKKRNQCATLSPLTNCA